MAAKRRRATPKRRPHSPLLDTAQAYLDEGRPDFAVMVLAEAVRGAPDDPAPQTLLARAYAAQSQWAECEPVARALVTKNPKDLAARTLLMESLARQDRFEQARQLLEPWPNSKDAQSLFRIGSLCLEFGFMRESQRAHRAAFALDPSVPGLVLGLSKVVRFDDTDRALIERIEKLARRLRDIDLLAADAHFALGKAYEDIGELERSAEHYVEANRRVSATVDFDPGAHAQAVSSIIDTFTAQRCSALAATATSNPRPVLIVGMPRSGTTLVERILCAHPDVAAGGELMLLETVANGLRREMASAEPYPRCAAEMTPKHAAWVARSYLSGLDDIDAKAPRVTDKLPVNFLHLGLVACALPGASVIHCRRARDDVSASIFFQQFSAGNDWSYRPEHVAAFYAQYERIMRHWRALPGLRLFEVDYEQLVTKPRPNVEALIAFIGVDWDDACLAPHAVAGSVRTASDWQVRAPINDASVGRGGRFAQAAPTLMSRLVGGEA